MDEQSIFAAALDCESPVELEAFLKEACGDDAELRGRVNRLLKLHDGAGSFLNAPAGRLVAPAGPQLSEKPGTRIGSYTLGEQIGEGGFGVVFIAEQTAPVRRKVALKIVKPGMDSKEVISRFEAERQALALMDHPNIARVLDAGTTSDPGRPYFVMELVEGTPMTEFCDEQKFSADERLRLFVDVCGALQHAHQKGIIHRDLKPSNILVTRQDDRPVAKVIDFGVAKALDQRLTDNTVRTVVGQMLGTPLYMSPEQAELTGLDVDTRSDVYSLGVLLYELLTGTTPFDRQRMINAGFDELRRILREVEPPRPSARVSTLNAGLLSTISAKRHLDARKLGSKLRGELDWIVMKALEKDRERRYESAGALAEDIQRYLHDEPVKAGPPSAWYRFRKLARRNHVVLLAASLVFASLVIGLSAAVWQTVQARREERRAVEAEVLASQRLAEATQARKYNTELLWRTYLSQARALRYTGRIGCRFESRDVLRRASRMLPDLPDRDSRVRELRNEWIACSALPADYRRLCLLPADRKLCGMNPAGDAYLFVDSAGAMHLHRIDGGEQLLVLPGPADYRDGVGGAIFSADGRYVALRYLEGPREFGLFRVWDLAEPRIVRDISTARDCVALDYSSDSRLLVFGKKDEQIYRVDLMTGDELTPLSGGAAPPASLRISPDGSRIAVVFSSSHDVLVLDAGTGEMVRTLHHSQRATACSWSFDSRFLAVSCDDHNIHVWDVPSGQRHAILRGHRWMVIGVTFWPRSHRLISWSWDTTHRLWDGLSGRQLLEMPGANRAFQISRDERRMASRSDSGRSAIWEIETSSTFRRLGISAPGSSERYGVAIHPTGRILACATTRGIYLWDLAANSEITVLPVRSCYGVAFHPRHGSLIGSGASGLYQVPLKIDERSGRVRMGPPEPITLRSKGPMLRCALSADGRFVVAMAGSRLLWCDLETDESAIASYWNPNAGHTRVAVSPDGRWGATGPGQSSGLRIWDTRGEQDSSIRDLWPGADRVMPTFDPQGDWLFACTRDECRVYQVGSWKIVHRIEGHTRDDTGEDYFGPSAVSPDGRVIAVRAAGNRVQLIDTEKWNDLATLEPFAPQLITSLAFGPAGDQLAAATINGPVYFWDLRALRQELIRIGADWKQPPLPPAENALLNLKPVKFTTAPVSLVPIQIEAPRDTQREQTNRASIVDDN